MSLKEWFGKGPKGDWVDIGAPKKTVNFKHVDGPQQKDLKENIQSVFQGLRLKA